LPEVHFVRVIQKTQDLGILFKSRGYINIPEGKTSVAWIP